MKSFLSLTVLCLAVFICGCEPPSKPRTEPAKLVPSIGAAVADSSNPAQLAQIKTVQPVGSTSPIVIIPPIVPPAPPTPTLLCEPIDSANLAEYEHLKKLLCAQPWRSVYGFWGDVDRSLPTGYIIRGTEATVNIEYLHSFYPDGTAVFTVTLENRPPEIIHTYWCFQRTEDTRVGSLTRTFPWELRIKSVLWYYTMILTESDLRLGSAVFGKIDGIHFAPVRR